MGLRKFARLERILLILGLVCILFSCSANVNLQQCEINVKQENTDIPSGSGYFNFGNIPLGFSQTITFTIENTGIAELCLTGLYKVEIKGQNKSDYVSMSYMTSSTINAESETIFQIKFKPLSLGTKSATISIENNDNDENPYTFAIVGNGTQPAPEIHVKQDTTDILCITGSYDFGTVEVNVESEKIEFTIENIGNEDLELTAISDKISVTGTNADLFNVYQHDIQSTVSGGDSTKFEVTFRPTSPGIKTAKINILNNDSDENPYVFTVTGTAIAAPEINVKQGSDDILNTSGKYSFVDTLVNESTEVVFTIENIGTATLQVENIEITGANAAMFSVNNTSTDEYITQGSSTTFKLSFNPTDAGTKTAAVSITNNDNDENPYTFTIEGYCLSPEINIKQGSDNILNSTGECYLPGIKVNASTPEIEFTIENLGDGDLQLTGSPIVEISGINASEFSVDTNSTLTRISASSSTIFKMQCNPVSQGLKTATISIANSDADENPYTFTIYGFGAVYTKGDVNSDGYADVVVGANEDDDGGNDSGCAFIFFGKSNISSTVDASNANVKLIGEDAGDSFGLYVSMAGDINNDGFEDVLVGADENDRGGNRSGCGYIFFGRYNWGSSIDASKANVIIVGEEALDHMGTCISMAGDVNNDGIDDIVIGAQGNDDGGSSAGCVYIFFGKQTWSSLIDASNADVRIIGEEEGDYLGYSVTTAGDVNHDGIDDLIAGAYLDDDGGSISGCAFIFYGRNSWNSTIDASTYDVKLVGEDEGDRFGEKVTNAGDINKDGIDDIIVGAPYDESNGHNSGSVYVFFGRQNWASIVDASNADVKIMGDSISNVLGLTISTTGDINNDGIDDTILSAPYGYYSGVRTGCSYIFFGRSAWTSATMYASDCNILLYGEDDADVFGRSVSSAGDLNKDGKPDIIVSAYGDDDGGNHAGCAYIYYGRSNWNSPLCGTDANVKLVGEDAEDYFGQSVAGH